MRITWRRQPSETGLARVSQGPRGAILRVDGEDVARVSVIRSRVTFGEYTGWYYYVYSARLGIQYANTAETPEATLELAKAACEAYVRGELAGRA